MNIIRVDLPESAISRSVPMYPVFPADVFVDSVGVNIHLHYDGTLYVNDFPFIKNILQVGHFRHVRDGMIDTTWQSYYDRHNELGKIGIQTLFISGLNGVVADYPYRMFDCFGAYEAPNEPDLSGDSNWVWKTRNVLYELRSEQFNQFPVIGPSLTNWGSFNALGSIGHWADIGNLHNYLAGHHPGTGGWGGYAYGSLGYHKMLMSIMMPADSPIITTETGYGSNETPDDVIAKYLVRLLLYQFINGISRTYIYELADIPGFGTFSEYGLVRANGTLKPAYTAIQNLLGILNDPGPSFIPKKIIYEVDGSVSHVMFQNRGGENFLVLWQEVEGWDVNNRTPIIVNPITVGVRVHAMSIEMGLHWEDDGMFTSFPGSHAETQNIAVDDRITVLKIV